MTHVTFTDRAVSRIEAALAKVVDVQAVQAAQIGALLDGQASLEQGQTALLARQEEADQALAGIDQGIGAVLDLLGAQDPPSA